MKYNGTFAAFKKFQSLNFTCFHLKFVMAVVAMYFMGPMVMDVIDIMTIYVLSKFQHQKAFPCAP